jgi:hypothetical protein
MTKILELNKGDFKEFVSDMIETDGLDWALSRIYDNDGLIRCTIFDKTRRGSTYWSNIYRNGYKATLTKEEIEKRLDMQPGTLVIATE